MYPTPAPNPPVCGPHNITAGPLDPGPRILSSRHRRNQAVQPSIRRGPIRSDHRRGQKGNQQLLQLVLHHVHGGSDHRSHRGGLHSGQYQLGVGVWNTDFVHVRVYRAVLFRNEALRVREAGGERVLRHRSGACRGLQETRAWGSGGRGRGRWRRGVLRSATSGNNGDKAPSHVSIQVIM